MRALLFGAPVASLLLAASASFAATETVLYAFQGTDGATPYAAPTLGADGNLYGTTLFGGTAGLGTVYELVHGGSGWTEKVLHSFTGGSDGSWAYGGVVLDSKGNIYGGTRSGGGPNGCGVIYELSPRHGQWTEKILYTFSDHEGCEGGPMGALTFDSMGNLYGPAVGDSPCGGFYYYGIVFELRRTRNGWKERDLHDFCGSPDGYGPVYGQLVFDSAGNLYGSSGFGGSGGLGTIFELSPAAHRQWTFTTLHSFTYDEGGVVEGGITRDDAGNLYGAEGSAGPQRLGGVYELSPGGRGQWNETTPYVFNGPPDGVDPFQNPVFDSSGNLFGTTYNGGDIDDCYDECGVIYELVPQEGGGWSESVVYNFASLSGGADGYAPVAGLVSDGKGHFFGTTTKGGAVIGKRPCDCGVVYEFTP